MITELSGTWNIIIKLYNRNGSGEAGKEIVKQKGKYFLLPILIYFPD